MKRRANTDRFFPAMKTAVKWIDRIKETYDEIAEYIWDHPELSLVEYKASERLIRFLNGYGFSIKKGISGMPTAFVATRGSGKPKIGFLAEYDGLPNLSQESGVLDPKPMIAGGPGQGCGHNLMGTSSVTAAIAAAEAMDQHGIRGTISVFGTPAEETLIGKLFMARDEVFDGTDIILSWHPRDINSADYNTYLALRSGKFQFRGKSAHGGVFPEQGRSALSAVELMNIGVNSMRQHTIQEARIDHIISKGGETPNNIPSFAENYYFVRAPRIAQVEQIWNWMVDIARGAALMTQTTMTCHLIATIYERLPNRTLAEMGDAIVKLIGPPPFTAQDQEFGHQIVRRLGRKITGESFSTGIESPDLTRTFPDVFVVKASNDQGNISWKIPVLNFSAATRAKYTPNHSLLLVCQAKSRPALRAGLQVSKWLSASALKLLVSPQIIKEAWKEFKGYISEFGAYKDPMPAKVKVPSFEMLYGIKPETVPGMNDTQMENHEGWHRHSKKTRSL